MKKLSKLKMTLWEEGVSQAELSRRTGINRTYIVFGISGRLIFTEEEKKKISRAIKHPVEKIFPES